MAAVGGTIVRAGRLAPILAAAALLAPALAGSGCFKPNITDGGFRCADGGICPDGFKCDQGGFCVKHLPDGGVGGKGGKAGGGGGSGAGGMGGGPPLSCFEPKVGCEPPDAGTDAGLCDPLCQTGCAGCREKCSVTTAGDLTCNEVTTSGQLKGLLEACVISSESSAAQSDNCLPGLTCIADGCGGGARCYQFCRVDQDCGNAACDRPVGNSGLKVCDVPYKTCVPVGSTSGCNPAVSTEACYLSSTHPDHTVCDCPFKAGGPNDACERSRDCNRGLACAFRGGSRKCLKVCVIDADCDLGEPGSCHPYTGASGAGPENTTYGFCY
jgi:hypothetical protein